MKLQRELRAWHDGAFPDAPNAAIGLKLGEECGELQKAINLLEHARQLSPADVGAAIRNLGEELGDVAIVLYVIADRYGFDLDMRVAHRAVTVIERPPRGV